MAGSNGSRLDVRGNGPADAELLIAIRRNDARAMREFVRRFELILRDQARRLGVLESDRQTVIMEFMDDMLVKLAQSESPRHLTSFVVRSFRNHVIDMHREQAAYDRLLQSLELVDGAEAMAAMGCSEFMLRSAIGQHDAGQPAPPAHSSRDMLVHALFDGCSVEDRQLLVWSAHRVPLRECAEWLGISYDSARQRISRLRSKLVRECVAYIDELPQADRDALTRLLGWTSSSAVNESTEDTVI